MLLVPDEQRIAKWLKRPAAVNSVRANSSAFAALCICLAIPIALSIGVSFRTAYFTKRKRTLNKLGRALIEAANAIFEWSLYIFGDGLRFLEDYIWVQIVTGGEAAVAFVAKTVNYRYASQAQPQISHSKRTAKPKARDSAFQSFKNKIAPGKSILTQGVSSGNGSAEIKKSPVAIATPPREKATCDDQIIREELLVNCGGFTEPCVVPADHIEDNYQLRGPVKDLGDSVACHAGDNPAPLIDCAAQGGSSRPSSIALTAVDDISPEYADDDTVSTLTAPPDRDSPSPVLPFLQGYSSRKLNSSMSDITYSDTEEQEVMSDPGYYPFRLRGDVYRTADDVMSASGVGVSSVLSAPSLRSYAPGLFGSSSNIGPPLNDSIPVFESRFASSFAPGLDSDCSRMSSPRAVVSDSVSAASAGSGSDMSKPSYAPIAPPGLERSSLNSYWLDGGFRRLPPSDVSRSKPLGDSVSPQATTGGFVMTSNSGRVFSDFSRDSSSCRTTDSFIAPALFGEAVRKTTPNSFIVQK